MRQYITENGSDDASVSETLALPDTQYVVIDIGGNDTFFRYSHNTILVKEKRTLYVNKL